MRYWVYADSRLLGPFAREDLASVPGLSRDSLVCPEGASGAVEKDWRALSSIDELTGIFSSAGGLPPTSTLTADSFDQFSQGAHDAIERIGRLEDYGTSIISDPRLLEALGETAAWVGPDEQLEADRSHVLELEDRLTQLKGQLETYEHKQDEILDHLSAKDKLLQEKDKELEALRGRMEELLRRPPQVSVSAPLPAVEAPPPKPQPQAPPPPPPPPPAPKVEAVVPPPEPALAESPPPAKIAGIEIVPFADFEPTAPSRRRTEEVPPPMADEPPAAADSAIPDMAPAPAAEEALPPPMSEAVLAPPPAAPDSFAGETLRASSDLPDGMDFVPPMPEEAAAAPAPAEMPAFQPPEMAPAEPEPLPTPSALDAPPPMPAEPVLGESAGPGEQVFSSSGTEAPETLMFAMPEGQSEAVPLPETGVISAVGPGAGEIPLTAPPRNIFEDPQGAALGQTQGQVQLPSDLNLTPPPIAGAQPAGLIPGMGGLMPGQLPTPIPIPLGGATPFPGQFQTPMPTMGQPDLPQSVMAGLGVQPTSTPAPLSQTSPGPDIGGQSFEDLMGKPPTLPPSLTNAPGATMTPGLTVGTQPPSLTSVPSVIQKEESKPKKSKKFLIGMGAAGVALLLIMGLFLRNPKQVSKMVDMSPEQKAQGELSVGGQDPAANPAGLQPGMQAPQTPPQTGNQSPFPPKQGGPAPAPYAQPEPEPEPEAAQSRDFIMDQRIGAIEFVKNYTLDSERGSISQWLDYAFLTPGHTPEWTAGAVEANVWIVEFNVFRGARSKKPRVAYRFEVNLAEKTVVGANTAAKDLLSGGTSKPAVEEERPRAARPKAVSRGRPRKSASRTISHTVQDDEQEPLPEEEELDQGMVQSPPNFNNPASP